MTNEIQQTRYDRLVRRVGGIIGPGSKVAEVLTELFPVIDIERVPGELLILGGTDLAQGAAQILGAAGEVGRIQVFNPLSSGKILTVTTILASTNTTTILRLATTNNELLTNVDTQVFRDRRRLFTSRPVGVIRQDSTVALTDAHITARVVSNVTFQLHDENGLAFLPPGSGYEIGHNTVATILNASFIWREREAEPSELNL